MKPTNLIIIMSDEHDPRYMGVSGDPLARTPNLDRLAGNGMRFRDAYTNSPICVPARASFATGAYAHDIGYWDNAIAYDGAVKGWGHALQEAGVRVESIGKLHYRSSEDAAGFDAEHLSMHIYNGHGMVWGSVRDPLPARQPRGGRMLGDRIGAGESTYTTYDASVTARALDWLDDAATADSPSPWCLFVGLVAPHFPLVVAEEYLSLYSLEELPPRKLHPRNGFPRHPWIQRHHDFWPTEDQFHDEQERLTAMAAYLGLVSWMDHNVGQILDALERCGLADSTRVLYTSDHGDNVGHRGLWGKSNFYLESVAVPMIMSGPGVPVGVNDTPISLLDVQPTVLQSFGLKMDATPLDPELRRPGRSLLDIASDDLDRERVVFSEYHAGGSPSAGFMLRKGRWKYHHYIDYEPELFDLDSDREELNDLGSSAEHADTVEMMQSELREICDPDAVDRAAKDDQARLIEKHGGREKALLVGAPGATPVPGIVAKFGD